jgi:hypothetical protein
MQPDGKRLKKKELSVELLRNEGLAASLPDWPECEEKAIAQT